MAANDVGNAHVGGRKVTVGGRKDGLRYRSIQEQPLSFRFRPHHLVHAFHFQRLAVVQHFKPTVAHMLPQRTELRFVFRHGPIRGPAESTPAGRFAERIAMPAPTISRWPRLRHPRRRCDPDRPAMAVHGNVTVCEVMIAGDELRSHGVGVWRYLQVLHGWIAFHLAMHAVARHRGVSIRSLQVAEYIVKGTVLANDEEDMLQMRQRTALHARGHVVADHGWLSAPQDAPPRWRGWPRCCPAQAHRCRRHAAPG